MGRPHGAGPFNFDLHSGHRSKIFGFVLAKMLEFDFQSFIFVPSSPARAATTTSPGGSDTPEFGFVLAKIPGFDLSIFCAKVNITMINYPKAHRGSPRWPRRTLNGP